MNSHEIVQKLDLKPHPEGGYYREVYRCSEQIAGSALPDRYDSDHAMKTAIYYLLTADSVSKMHRIRSDEIFHFYRGSPAHMVLLHPDGSSETVILGNNIAEDEQPLCVVEHGTWFGLYLEDGADYVLLGTTVAPGFEFADFELADRAFLINKYPDQAETIRKLT